MVGDLIMSLFRDDTSEAQAIWANVEYAAQFVPEWVKPQVIAAAKEHVKLMRENRAKVNAGLKPKVCVFCNRPF